MLFLDGVYLDAVNGFPARFRWVKAPTSDELNELVYTIASRIGHFLERRGLMERDIDDCMDAGGRATHGAVAEVICRPEGWNWPEYGNALPAFPGRAAASDNDSWRWAGSVWVDFRERGVYSS